MFILQIIGWFIASCILMSFIEHQVHSRLMHRKNFLSERTASFKRTFEAHANVHHKHYTKIFSDEPVARGADEEIRMNPFKGMLRAIPIALLLSVVSWQFAIIFVAVVGLHHAIWNMIHLEMHKPEQRYFSSWPVYKFLARHHCLHHLHQNKNFNVVFPFADYVLGTNVKPDERDLKALREFGLAPKPKLVLTGVK
jgi:sterol desaturase/sphingolipid hydroxylase (fatty acid hydroxylase superfamily)